MTGETRDARRITRLLMAAVALIGLAWLCLLPPFEGHDETAHWSYIQELADWGQSPDPHYDGLSVDIDFYPGPLRYGDAPPYEHTGRDTYRSRREAGAKPVGGSPVRFLSDRELNWQSQHPPAYYAAMAPILRLTRGWDWVDHILALRVASFALAFAGYAIGVLATARRAQAPGLRLGMWAAPILAAWPLLAPEFFPEMARMGNDSLCLLAMGVAWAALLRMLDGEPGPRWVSAAVLGVALGVGLLTKAFFLPIGAGIGALLLLRALANWRRLAGFGEAAVAGGLTLAIGAKWYVMERLSTGSFTGSEEVMRMKAAGLGIFSGYDSGEFLHGLALIAKTFAWGGSWSQLQPPQILLIAPLALLAVAAFGYILSLRRVRIIDLAPLALGLPMLAGLVYHVFVWMAGTAAETPGWYLHILAAPLGLALARGWRWPRLLGALAALTTLSTAGLWLLQASMFSGCAAKLGADAHYGFRGAGCLVSWPELAATGHPLVAVLTLAAGTGLALAAGGLAVTAWRQAKKPALL